MPRRRSLVPSHSLEIAIRQDLRARLDLELYSELEGRIPFGAYKQFFEERLVEYFEQRRQGIYLAPYIPDADPSLTVYGTPAAIATLEAHLRAGWGRRRGDVERRREPRQEKA